MVASSHNFLRNIDVFQFTGSFKQGCSLAPFLNHFVVDCLGHVLEENNGIQDIKLSNGIWTVVDLEFVDVTNL